MVENKMFLLEKYKNQIIIDPITTLFNKFVFINVETIAISWVQLTPRFKVSKQA